MGTGSIGVPTTEWTCKAIGKSGGVLVSIDAPVNGSSTAWQMQIETPEWLLSCTLGTDQTVEALIERFQASEQTHATVDILLGTIFGVPTGLRCNDEAPGRVRLRIGALAGEYLTLNVRAEISRQIYEALRDTLGQLGYEPTT